MLLGNSEVFVGTSSSNSALVLNKDGIAIGSGGEIAINSDKGIWIGTIGANDARIDSIELSPSGINIASGATINMTSENFKVSSNSTNGNNIFEVRLTDVTDVPVFSASQAYTVNDYIRYESNGICAIYTFK